MSNFSYHVPSLRSILTSILALSLAIISGIFDILFSQGENEIIKTCIRIAVFIAFSISIPDLKMKNYKFPYNYNKLWIAYFLKYSAATLLIPMIVSIFLLWRNPFIHENPFFDMNIYMAQTTVIISIFFLLLTAAYDLYVKIILVKIIRDAEQFRSEREY